MREIHPHILQKPQAKKRYPEARYVMVGDGQLKDEVRHLVAELDLTENVDFLPATSKPADCYSALDAFLMPSVSEGFGLAAIEAQCSGLPVLASDVLPKAVEVTGHIVRIPLAVGTEGWAQALADVLEKAPADRRRSSQAVRDVGFDIDGYAERILQRYKSEELRGGLVGRRDEVDAGKAIYAA